MGRGGRRGGIYNVGYGSALYSLDRGFFLFAFKVRHVCPGIIKCSDMEGGGVLGRGRLKNKLSVINKTSLAHC